MFIKLPALFALFSLVAKGASFRINPPCVISYSANFSFQVNNVPLLSLISLPVPVSRSRVVVQFFSAVFLV